MNIRRGLEVYQSQCGRTIRNGALKSRLVKRGKFDGERRRLISKT